MACGRPAGGDWQLVSFPKLLKSTHVSLHLIPFGLLWFVHVFGDLTSCHLSVLHRSLSSIERKVSRKVTFGERLSTYQPERCSHRLAKPEPRSWALISKLVVSRWRCSERFNCQPSASQCTVFQSSRNRQVAIGGTNLAVLAGPF